MPFWYLLRFAQVAVFVQAALGALLLVTDHSAQENLHYLYGILPLVISFIAEGARLGAAQRELGELDIESFPPEAQEIDRPADRPPRDGHHGGQLHRDLLPRRPRRDDQRDLAARPRGAG